MTAKPFVVSPQDRTQPLRVVGEHITVLASAAQTGSYEIFFQAGPEGGGPPISVGPSARCPQWLGRRRTTGIGRCFTTCTST